MIMRAVSYEDRLSSWCRPLGQPNRIDSEQGYNLLRALLFYDPDKRLDAREALEHRWFQEEPIPTKKYGFSSFTLSCNFLLIHATTLSSAFEHATSKQIPPHRKITQDDAPSMMPAAAQAPGGGGSTEGGAGGGGSRKKARIG